MTSLKPANCGMPFESGNKTMLPQAVTILVEDIFQQRDDFPERSFTLTSEKCHMILGRSKQNGHRDAPSANNAYFENPAISRLHAMITYHPDTKQVSIQDLGSLHGTMADGTLLRRTQSRQLNSGDHVIVGVDVTEGNKQHHARHFRFTFIWHDQEAEKNQPLAIEKEATQTSQTGTRTKATTTYALPSTFMTMNAHLASNDLPADFKFQPSPYDPCDSELTPATYGDEEAYAADMSPYANSETQSGGGKHNAGPMTQLALPRTSLSTRLGGRIYFNQPSERVSTGSPYESLAYLAPDHSSVPKAEAKEGGLFDHGDQEQAMEETKSEVHSEHGAKEHAQDEVMSDCHDADADDDASSESRQESPESESQPDHDHSPEKDEDNVSISSEDSVSVGLENNVSVSLEASFGVGVSLYDGDGQLSDEESKHNEQAFQEQETDRRKQHAALWADLRRVEYDLDYEFEDDGKLSLSDLTALREEFHDEAFLEEYELYLEHRLNYIQEVNNLVHGDLRLQCSPDVLMNLHADFEEQTVFKVYKEYLRHRITTAHQATGLAIEGLKLEKLDAAEYSAIGSEEVEEAVGSSSPLHISISSTSSAKERSTPPSSQGIMDLNVIEGEPRADKSDGHDSHSDREFSPLQDDEAFQERVALYNPKSLNHVTSSNKQKFNGNSIFGNMGETPAEAAARAKIRPKNAILDELDDQPDAKAPSDFQALIRHLNDASTRRDRLDQEKAESELWMQRYMTPGPVFTGGMKTGPHMASHHQEAEISASRLSAAAATGHKVDQEKKGDDELPMQAQPVVKEHSINECKKRKAEEMDVDDELPVMIANDELSVMDTDEEFPITVTYDDIAAMVIDTELPVMVTTATETCVPTASADTDTSAFLSPASTSKDTIEQPATKRARMMAVARPFLLGAIVGGAGLLTALVSLPESYF